MDEIGLKICRVFKTHGNSYQLGADAKVIFLFFGDDGMGEREWMLDKAFHAAEADGEVEIAGCRQDALDPCQITFHLNGDHAAKIEHLPSRQVMLGMAGQSRIDDLAQSERPATLLQGLRQFEGGIGLPDAADLQRFQ